MKKCFLLLFLSCLSSFAQDVWVNSYVRTDGTVVPAHYRTNRDYTVNNNYTTEGNINPYTGKAGTLPRDNVYPIQTPLNLPLISTKQNNNSSNSYQINVTTALSGSYNVPLIEEQIFENGKWKTIKEEKSNSYLFFDKDIVRFKRGQNKWLCRGQVFKNFNSEANMYVYDSNFGSILLDSYLRFIIFYDTNSSTKRYVYIIGDSAPNIIPTD
ncbi:hypothetical protein [Flavobacterium sp. 3-210]